ncbi:hypothetical protein DYU11_22705 [Fibrisoma montanum]|uniref:Uncharacterized protein n=1 Tax=Fibrisoma montanum TaxID=2305895 RepID=A0A418M1X0_9BACT|nr:hypothetical protein [Fibrisoma montanum]RIV19743.1 hypothetical protein DYU11_22705 [Fibrisoma montanum]
MKNTSALDIAKAQPETAIVPLLALQRNITLEVAATSPTVRQVEKTLGQPTLLKLVCVLLRFFNDSLNTTLQMTPMQLFECAQLWLELFPNETVKDLVLCLKRAKTGHYGPIYNRIDISVINHFFRQYLTEKANWGEQQASKYKGSLNGRDQGVLPALPDDQRKALIQLTKRPEIRPTSLDGLKLTDRMYLEWLRKNVKTLELELLQDIAFHASQKNSQEALALVDAELIRRSNQTADATNQIDDANRTYHS